MDNIDFYSLIPDVINAFSTVYGEEYHPMISNRLHNMVILPYKDVLGLEDYISYIKQCKAREFSLKFLHKIGKIPKYQQENYTKFFDDKIEDILEYYIHSPLFGFSKRKDYWAPLRAFRNDNQAKPEQLLENKLKLINYLRGNEQNQITEENFNEFTTTQKNM